MSSSKDICKKWDFESTKLFYEVLQGKFPDKFPIHCDLKLTPQQAFDVIYLLQEYFSAIPDVFEKCDKCQILYDSDDEGEHIELVGINLCDACIDEITGFKYYSDMDELAEDIKKFWDKFTVVSKEE